jgi:hypothetical protein
LLVDRENEIYFSPASLRVCGRQPFKTVSTGLTSRTTSLAKSPKPNEKNSLLGGSLQRQEIQGPNFNAKALLLKKGSLF